MIMWSAYQLRGRYWNILRNTKLNQNHKLEQNDRCIHAYFKDQNWD